MSRDTREIEQPCDVEVDVESEFRLDGPPPSARVNPADRHPMSDPWRTFSTGTRDTAPGLPVIFPCAVVITVTSEGHTALSVTRSWSQ